MLSRLSRPLVLAAAAALLFSAPLAPSRILAQDGAEPEPSPDEAYEARLATGMTEIARLYETPASYAMSNKLKRTGLEIYQRVLEYDPDNKKARRELGFDEKGGEWVPNERKQSKIDEYEDTSSKKLGDYQDRLEKANLGTARILAELGTLAEKAGRRTEARKHWKKAIILDDQNDVANKGMGNEVVDGKCFSKQALAHKDWNKVYRTTLDKAQKMGVAVVAADESAGVAEAAGINMKRYKSKNFRIESTLSDAEIRETLVWLERARSFYLELFDIPERLLEYELDPMVFVLAGTGEQKDKLIDACPQIPPEQKSFKKRFSHVAVGGKLELGIAQNGESAQRHCIHTATHTMVRDTLGNHAPWLSEALANSVSAAVKGADLTVCFSGEGSTGGIHLERIGLDAAPALLRELILAKKDTPLDEFVKLPSDGMTAQQIAKAWSVAMFLLEMDRMMARDYFAAAGQGQGGDNSKDDRVLKQYFTDFQRWDDLDEIWREWAVDVYKER